MTLAYNFEVVNGNEVGEGDELDGKTSMQSKVSCISEDSCEALLDYRHDTWIQNGALATTLILWNA